MSVNPEVKLAQIAEINPALPGDVGEDDLVSFVSMAQLSSDAAATDRGDDRRYGDVKKGYTPFMRGDVLVAKITPCFENSKIGSARIDRDVGVGSTEFHVIRPCPERADARYILHFLRQGRVLVEGERRMTGSAGQRRVPEEFLSELRLPDIELSEQRRIAVILDQAEALRAKRKEAITKLDTLAQSIFLDMFSDPASRGWKVETIEQVAQAQIGAIRTGPFGSQLLHSEFTESGVAVLGIDNAVHNEFRWGERRHISEEKYRELVRYTVRPGDVLITIMGTCGRCAIVPDDIPVAINTKHLCCITLDRQKCIPSFLHAYFLWHPLARRYLARTAKGAIMEGLNMGIIKGMPVPRAPIGLQENFDKVLKRLNSVLANQRRSEAYLEVLAASLQQRAFRGEL